jgi:hypothetical protein
MTINKKYKVRCLNNRPLVDGGGIQNLIIGKIYETNDKPYSSYFAVVNDLGNEVCYSAERFEVITLEEFREEKLKEIGI